MIVFREFSGLETRGKRLPDESTFLRIRHVLEKDKLAAQFVQTVDYFLSENDVKLKCGGVADATFIAAPSSTKNSKIERYPEMKQSRKGQQCFFGKKCDIGVDIESVQAHAFKGTSGAVNDVIEAKPGASQSPRGLRQGRISRCWQAA